MTDRELIQAAAQLLTPGDFNVWLTKHIAGKGRRAGSLALGITEDAWRYRLQRADRILHNHINQEQAA